MLPTLRDLGTVGRELKALATTALALPLRPLLPTDDFDPDALHPTPVVLVHGLCGDPTNFLTVRRALAAAGIRNFATFAYRPQFGYQQLIARLSATIEKVCRETGATQVDIVAHSLGGMIARGAVEGRIGFRVRRLVTLGAPYMTSSLPPQELALFGASDPLIPMPDATHGPRERVVVVPGCGHLGLLYDPAVLRTITTHLCAATTVASITRPSPGSRRALVAVRDAA